MKTNKTPSAYQRPRLRLRPSPCIHLLLMVSRLRPEPTHTPAGLPQLGTPSLPAAGVNAFGPASVSGHLWCEAQRWVLWGRGTGWELLPGLNGLPAWPGKQALTLTISFSQHL